MRVLVLTTSYPLDSTSTSGVFVARLVEQVSRDIAVTVLVPASRRADAALEAHGKSSIKTFRYAPRCWQRLAHEPGGIPVALQRQKLTYLLLPAFLLSMFFHCLWHGRRADVIHANWAVCGLIAGLAGKILRVPVITTLRGDDVTRAQKKKVDWLILALCLRFSKRVVSVSTAIRDWAMTVHPKHAGKVEVIENGVDESFLNISSPNRSAFPLRFVTIGSLIPRKNVGAIIQALDMAKNKNRVVLSVIGTGPERPALEKLARATAGTRVEFAGEVAPHEIPQVLASSDIFVIASRSEGRPNVVLEAMAVGLPVIASDIAGVNELVEHGVTGLLFPLDNIPQLSSYIDKLVDQSELRMSLGQAGRAAIRRRKLVWQETAQKYRLLYQTVSTRPLSCAES